MYVSSSSPVPMGNASCQTKASDRAIAQDQCRVSKGRMALFYTTPSVSSLYSVSPELAADAVNILSQSEVARASVVGAGTPAGTLVSNDAGAVLQGAPAVQPLNGLPLDMNACGRAAAVPRLRRQPRLSNKPVMPQAGPVLTTTGSSGLSGIAPPWGDGPMAETLGSPEGGFLGWVKAHPLISLAVAGGLVVLATDERRRGRRGY